MLVALLAAQALAQLDSTHPRQIPVQDEKVDFRFPQLVEGFFHQVEAGRWGPRDPRSSVPSIYGPGGKPC